MLERVKNSGRASYVERNQAMIDVSDICIFYCDKNYLPNEKHTRRGLFAYQPKSGTKVACEYAKKHNKEMINLSE